MDSFSLISSRCQKTYSCIAFAVSTSHNALPVLEVRFALKSAVDVVINAWIVVCELNPLTAFVEGGQEGTIMVPATESSVVSVAGVKSDGQMWDGSSRGPAAQYGLSAPSKSSPLVAHRVDLGSELPGTSFASPRVCGDATSVIVNSTKLANCNDAVDLIFETYPTRATHWNARSGYHKQTS
jgi:hypothetical protein